MKENFDEENSPTCVLYPNTHTLPCFSSIKTLWEEKSRIKKMFSKQIIKIASGDT